ncbi:MAG: [protein-PII] uridylyltransferase [Gemmatimonas sp.]
MYAVSSPATAIDIPPKQPSTTTGAAAALQTLDPDLAPDRLRPEALRVLKAAVDEGRSAIRARFDAGATGSETVAAQCRFVDDLLTAVLDFTIARVFPVSNPTKGERMGVVAVGGYGRGELAPHSDVDLLFLRPYKKTPHTEQVIEFVLYLLWDLGFKVGQAVRSVDECIRLAKGDITIRTSILESRPVWGDAKLHAELMRRFWKEVVAGTESDFVEAKLAERDARHARMGDSRYVLEPNVKEGKGGLRDLHTLFWITKYIYRVSQVSEIVKLGVLSEREARRFIQAQNFLWHVRCHLHYLTGRAEERLTFDLQEQVGRLMGYTDRAGARGVERFMKHYFLYAKEVGDLTRIFCAALEESHKRPSSAASFLGRFRWRRKGGETQQVDGFAVKGDRLTVASPDAFEKDPVNLIGLFAVAHRHRLDIHPEALRLVTRSLRLIDEGLRADPEANRLFLDMLASKDNSEFWLRRMNEAGVFGRFIPDFGRVVAQMQHDMYHVFTVDEHTLMALGILHKVELGELKEEMPVISDAIHNVQSRRALYLSVLLHDIAKGRGGDHSELGAEIALKLGPRLGLTDEETETVSWLVRHHLIMSNTAFKRDVSDPRTVRDFVAIVQSVERLRLLLALTVADIRAVGPTVWNGWKGALLRELALAAEEMIEGGLKAEARDERVRAAQTALRAELPDWDDEAFGSHLARGYPGYWLAFDPPTLARQARLVRAAEEAGRSFAVEESSDAYRAVTEITVYATDHAGLFSQIAGAIALAGGNVVDARITTMTNGMALDVFWIQDVNEEAFDKPDKLAHLRGLIERSVSGRIRPGRELAGKRSGPTRTRVFKVAPRVLVDNAVSATHTVIEVNGRDRPGFLFDVTSALTDLNLQISTAKISTYGARAVDVFYVKDLFGLKVVHDGKLEQIRKRLLDVLVDPDDRGKGETTRVAAVG